MSRTGLSLAPDAMPEACFDTQAWERSLGRPLCAGRALNWRSRIVAMAALLGCLALFLLVRALAATPTLDASWSADASGRLIVTPQHGRQGAAPEPDSLLGLLDAHGRPLPVSTSLLQRAPRWIVDDEERRRHAAMHERLNDALALGPVTLVLAESAPLGLRPHARGIGGLGVGFWLIAILALALYLTAAVVVAARPSERNAMYAVMAISQALNLGFIAAESMPGLLVPAWLLTLDFPVRTALDLLTAAALVHATGVHPTPVRGRWWTACAAWVGVGSLMLLTTTGQLPGAWWWTQGAAVILGGIAILQLSRQGGHQPHPAAILLRRLAMVAMGTLLLLTLAVAAASQRVDIAHFASAIGSTVWVVFLSSLLGLLPFLARSQQVLREFSMLAGVSTVATSLDLLFVAAFSLSQFASVTLALFISLGIYAGVRQWLLNRVMGNAVLTTERAFEQLYRLARELEGRPERVGERLSQLLRELFEPLEAMLVQRTLPSARVAGDGATLIVPVPTMPGGDALAPDASVVLRYARKGTRIFCDEDARLADRICEQLRRAVAFDQAVEQGRNEERTRLAQDLHDDIGARLLTLMYKAPDPETEEYVRHTLKDLKTLTRGLAASNHRLTHAAAEWKADITQRLSAAHCDLGWSFSVDDDIALNVVQWSALTRALRELINNVISHAQATRVDVDGAYDRGQLTIVVSDNGQGTEPEAWSHGLGLNGVRKRVRQLNGHVEWRTRHPQGIQCRIWIPSLTLSARDEWRNVP